MRALWSDRPNCSHNVSQKVKRIRHFSDCCFFFQCPFGLSCGLGVVGDGLGVLSSGFAHEKVRKILVSVIFPPAILGPKTAAPILWAPGIFFGFFLLENPRAHKIPRFRGGSWIFP